MNQKIVSLLGLALAARLAVAVTAPTIDPTTYEVTTAPKSVLVTFYDGPDTRGFAWETDASVSETKLWVIEGSHTSAEAALFDAASPVEGSYIDRTQGTSPAKTVRCHKAHATGLVSGTTYSYRVGGSGNYAYGTFTVNAAAGARTILYIGDSQVKYTPSFFVWENTVQRAAEVLPAAETDLVLFGGDMFDVYATSISAYNYLKWGATVDSATPYYPGVPWSLSSGNHDLDKSGYTYYADLTGVNYQTPSCHSYDFGAAHIAVLPFYSVSDVANVRAVAAWTDADLKAANAAGKTKWNVVMMHLGPYTTGDHGMNESSSIVQLFCPIFSSNHVDLVLQAHDHTYSKTLPYKWDTVGYTTTRTDATIVNTLPAQTKIGGETYDANPAGTYYVCTGCSGPRVYEGEGQYAFLDGAQSYDTERTYKVAAGTIAVDSIYGKKGDDASSELRAAMFGVLKVDETTLTYDWYAVNTNGLEAAVLYDTLRIAKGNTFRVTPYVQRPTTNAVSLLWLAQTNGNASVSWWEQGGATTNAIASATEIAPTDRVAGTRFTAEGVLQYCVAPELAYTNSVESADNYPTYTREGVGTSHEGAGWAMSYTVPYQYRVRLTGLKPDTLYGYRVTLENGASYEKSFRTAPAAWRPIRFAYFSDSETEPADNPLSTGRTGDWTSQADPTKTRTYYATQTEAYATNVARVVEFDPDFIVMAGDLAQKGSRQLDWDEFWRHNAGLLNDPAGSRPIFASPGNHDYWSYLDGGEAGMKKYLSYFEFEPNGAAVDADIQERFHRVDYGVATFLFMDANNGDDSDYTKDTNRYIARNNDDYSPYVAPQGRGCRAPDFNPGTPQYEWLETQLADAQKKSAFIFVVCHQCPYSVGDHGQPNVPDGTGGEILSGRALRVLEPLFHKYGVTAWLCGHDEMMERSTVTGTETCLDGTTRAHTLQIWDMGIAGDGLRGGMKIANPQEQYRAYVNSIEQYDAQGFQTDGGVHYGHLEVTITNRADGAWVATFDPVYEFFTTNAAGQAVFGGTRHYGDTVTVVNTDWIDEPQSSVSVQETRGYTNLEFQVTAALAGDYKVVVRDVQTGAQVGTAVTVEGFEAGVAKTFEIATADFGDGYETGRTYAYALVKADDETVVAGTVTYSDVGWKTNGYFGASAKTGTAVYNNGAWVLNTPEISDNMFAINSTQAVFRIANVQQSATRKIVTLDAEIDFTGYYDLAEVTNDLTSAIAALALVTNEEAAADAAWMVLTEGDTWTKITDTAYTTALGAYTTRIELDYNTATPRVRYSVKPETTDVWEVLATADGEWFDAKSAEAPVSNVCFIGRTGVAEFSADLSTKGVAEVNGTDYLDVASALASAADGTLVLYTNIQVDPRTLAAGTYALNLNGKTFTTNDVIWTKGDGAKTEVSIDGSTLTVAKKLFVAAIGDAVYTALQDAFDAAANGTVVVLTNVAQCATSTVARAILDLDGFTLTKSAADKPVIVVKGDTATLFAFNGAVADATDGVAFSATNGAALYLSDLFVTNNTTSVEAGAGATVTISNGCFSGAFVTDSGADTKINILGGFLVAKTAADLSFVGSGITAVGGRLTETTKTTVNTAAIKPAAYKFADFIVQPETNGYVFVCEIMTNIVSSGSEVVPTKTFIVTNGVGEAEGTVQLPDVYVAEAVKAAKVSSPSTAVQTQEFMNADAPYGRGLKRWECYVLGITNTETTTEGPYVKGVQDSKTGTIGFNVLTPTAIKAAESGCDVKFEVEEYTDASLTSSTGKTSGRVDYGKTAEIAAPTSGVRYYKLKMLITPKK